MLKFFRKIRQSLLSEGKTGKYLKYAVGEIVLVVIGIFLAIQLNELNEKRKDHEKELSFLSKLKDDIHLDITNLSQTDSLFASYESSSNRALKLFYSAKTVGDIIAVDTLFRTGWTNLKINRKTYDEMRNTSGIYILKNKKLINDITDYYALIEATQQQIAGLNLSSQTFFSSQDLIPHMLLVKDYNKPWFDINTIDTTWIGDFNAPTTLGLYRYYGNAQFGVNYLRREWGQSIIKSGRKVIHDIEQELKNKNYNQ
ncbi:DUF6090 family protein [Flagellimonas iocasae]|uniref:DUF6090 family protein n=1 Tax=Flagellimonas iocasae TaxID=2055905 RepID=A0ABW4XSJ0_9FLAO